MRTKTKEKRSYGSWKEFFHFVGSINLPWLVILVAFLAEMGYNQAMLMMPGTTTALMSGSLEAKALRDAVIYYICYAVVLFLDFMSVSTATSWAVRNARNKVWGGMTRIGMEYYDQHSPNALSSAITNDLQEAVSSLVRLIIQVIPAFYYIFGAMATIGEYDILLMLSVLVLLPVKWVYMVVVSRWMYSANAGIYQRIGQLTGYLAERVKNLPLIKYSCTEQQELENGSAAVSDLFTARMHSVKVGCANSGIGTVISLLQHMVTIIAGVLLLQAGRITIAQWIAFFLFANTINSRFGELIGYWQSLKSLQGTAARAVKIMDAPQEQTEKDAKAAGTQETVSRGAESVEFKNVSFAYGEKQALKNVSFAVPAGTTAAIVGLCGSGKTTLLNLLERFYEANEGRVLLNGSDAKNEDLSDLRSRFSYVQQDAGVFSGTVREILTYGIRREVSEQELTQAAKTAGAWDFIQKLPGGLDSPIAANGASISGGQRQRLVLAREFLRNADILLLDEPTSALDASTAQAVEETIFRMFKGKTILMVTHDMSLLKNMDQIVVMQEGEVKGSGAYEALMAQCPLFREMVQMQHMEVGPA